MAGKSTYLEAQLLTHVFRTASFTKPAAIYVGLFTAAPTDAGGGTECIGGSYARVLNGPSNAAWAAPTGANPSSMSNATIVAFPVPTGDWGRATHFGVFDAISGGNLLNWGVLTYPKNINNGDPAPTFPIGQLTLTED